MSAYRKKPIVIEAYQWNLPNPSEPPAWIISAMLDGHITHGGINSKAALRITTLEGVMTANPGDWIIKGVKGELYPCRPDIFEATYELVDGT